MLRSVWILEADIVKTYATRPSDTTRAQVFHVTNEWLSIDLSHQAVGSATCSSELSTLIGDNREEYRGVDESLNANPVVADLDVVSVIGPVPRPLLLFVQAGQGPSV